MSEAARKQFTLGRMSFLETEPLAKSAESCRKIRP